MKERKTPKIYLDLLRKTRDRFRKEALLSMGDIGTENSKVSLEHFVYFTRKSAKDVFDSINYQAHFGRVDRLLDLIAVNLPEYALEEVYREKYLDLRNKDVVIPVYEEILLESLIALERKYGKRKVFELKRKLRIKD